MHFRSRARIEQCTVPQREWNALSATTDHYDCSTDNDTTPDDYDDSRDTLTANRIRLDARCNSERRRAERVVPKDLQVWGELVTEILQRKVEIIARETLANLSDDDRNLYPTNGLVELVESTEDDEYVILYGGLPLAAVFRSYLDDDANLSYPMAYSPAVPDHFPEEWSE
ncbi:hypothetical protein [Rhodococcoides yunnanense]|uniref:Uncharacterized protein n=1 Tax=Rhodococcoides yunnanense TaxID=278209 RepID=A0ABU4BDQ0_9NOCA|nr:hypothetical protein [Rhodococcus yunnanensis]MDV6262334.1 hypothetical protein [Rhodococcus yunnanensis]